MCLTRSPSLLPPPWQVSQLWKEVVIRVGKEYPEVELSHMYIDNAAMQMIRNPKWFDTIVTGELQAGIHQECCGGHVPLSLALDP